MITLRQLEAGALSLHHTETMGPTNLHDSTKQTPCASSPERLPLNFQPHGLPDHSSPQGPIFPLYRVFLSSDDFYASTLFLDKNTGTTVRPFVVILRLI